MRKILFVYSLLVITLFLLIGCTGSSDHETSISINKDSEYVNTFEELSLGRLFDFNFNLSNADQRWVHIWVDKYLEGEKQAEPVIHLSYGLSPQDVDRGQLGFGLLDGDLENSLAFLYAPGAKTSPRPIDLLTSDGISHVWDYAIDEEDLELRLDETYRLAVYRQSSNNTIRTYDLRNDEQVEALIDADALVLILNIKVEAE